MNEYWASVLERIRLQVDDQLKTWKAPAGYVNFFWPTDFVIQTQAFGLHPEWYEPFGLPGHEGIDFRAPTGSPIYAVWDGVVSRAGWNNAYGNHIRLEHLIKVAGSEVENKYESVYGHFDNKEPLHQVGDLIKRGQVIGLADNTGNSYGSHLHFNLKQFDGTRPRTYLQMKFYNEWLKFNMIDPTLFFSPLRDGYV